MALTDAHKAALADGRTQSRAIKAYLTDLASKRAGGRITAKGLVGKIESVTERIDKERDPLKVVTLYQRRIELEDQLADLADTSDHEALEAGFVEHAATYSERKGISYSAWRQAGVPAAIVGRAGIRRTRRPA